MNLIHLQMLFKMVSFLSKFLSTCCLFTFVKIIYFRGCRGWEAQGCHWLIVMGKTSYLLIFYILCSGIKAKDWYWVQPLNTQSLEKFGWKWGTEGLNTRFHLPTLLYVRYREKSIYLKKLTLKSKNLKYLYAEILKWKIIF